jgi:hypothetical protein
MLRERFSDLPEQGLLWRRVGGVVVRHQNFFKSAQRLQSVNL